MFNVLSTPVKQKDDASAMAEMKSTVVIYETRSKRMISAYEKQLVKEKQQLDTYVKTSDRKNAQLALRTVMMTEKYIQDIRSNIMMANAMLKEAQSAQNAQQMIAIQKKTADMYKSFNRTFSVDRIEKISSSLKNNRETFKANTEKMNEINTRLMGDIVSDADGGDGDGDIDKQLDEYIQMNADMSELEAQSIIPHKNDFWANLATELFPDTPVHSVIVEGNVAKSNNNNNNNNN